MCDNFKIDETDHTVMIDECMLSKRKYNRGQLTQQLWIFSMIDCTTRNFVIQYVHDCKKETLFLIIKKYCEIGTTIWSDQWKAYNELSTIEGFDIVNHSNHLKDPTTKVCTNRIEGQFSCLRPFYRSKSTSRANKRENISSYLDEFQWGQFWDILDKPGETLSHLLCHSSERQGFD